MVACVFQKIACATSNARAASGFAAAFRSGLTFVSGLHQHHKQSRFATISRHTKPPDNKRDGLGVKDAGPRCARFRARIRFDRKEAALGV
jgi:hypothetical protein